MISRNRTLKGFSLVTLLCLAALSPANAALSWLGVPWWIWLLLGLALLVILVCVLSRPKTDVPAVHAAGPSVAAAETEAPPSESSPASTDDLRRVEGIGPRISGLLNESGIHNFAELAAADVTKLRAILEKAGLSHLADPGTWPEQASLAAAGRWDDLEKLQDELKGGRRN